MMSIFWCRNIYYNLTACHLSPLDIRINTIDNDYKNEQKWFNYDDTVNINLINSTVTEY